jgi:hypothetical protein
MKLAKSVTDNLRCLDHILNTAISEAWKKERKTPVSKVIAKATALATRTHKSSLSAGHIRQVCSEMPEDNKVKYRKIITPCETRWNSQFMCLQSIFQLKNALLRLKFEPRDAELVPLIPDEAEFDVIASLLPPLQELKNISTLQTLTRCFRSADLSSLTSSRRFVVFFRIFPYIIFFSACSRIFPYITFFFQHVPVLKTVVYIIFLLIAGFGGSGEQDSQPWQGEQLLRYGLLLASPLHGVSVEDQGHGDVQRHQKAFD